MKNGVSKKAVVRACGLAFVFGVALVYFMAVRPLKTEVVQYRTASFWINYLNENVDFGQPVGVAWKGSEYVVVYPTGYRLVVTSANETYALEPDGDRAPHSFKIFPPPDVRRIKLSQLEKVIGQFQKR